MNRQQIDALPNDPANLKRELVKLSDIVASYETAKQARIAAEAVAAASPAASFEIKVFEVKAQLEGLMDGSEDISDPKLRVEILRGAINLVNDLFDAVPKS